MLSAQRREALLDLLRTEGRIVSRETAARFGVSEDMIRRDLRELAAAGLAQRVYGGALPASPAVVDHSARTAVAPDSKRRVGAAAASLLTPGSVAVIDGGTTALALVAALPLTLDATVLTHSPAVAIALSECMDITVELIGGRLYRHSLVACGSVALNAASRIRADMFFMGVTGVHAEAGLTTGDREEAEMKRVFAARSGETYVLASSEKIGSASPFEVLPLSDVSGVITDAVDGPAYTNLYNTGIPVINA